MLPPIDPVSAAIDGGGLVLGLAQGIANSRADRSQQQYNKARLDKLLQRQKQGDLGLGPQQQQLLDRQLVAPVAQQAAAQRSRAEAIQANLGSGATGADLARLRGEQARTVGNAAQAAALQVSQADLAAKQQQKNEIEQRLALQTAQRQNDVNSMFSAVSQIAGAGGAQAGAPPEATHMYGMFGRQLSPADAGQMSDFAEKYPDDFQAMFQDFLRKMAGSGAMGAAGAADGAGAAGAAGLAAGLA